MDDPDVTLLEKWRGGDRAAGQALFQRHFDSLYRFFRNKCDSDSDELVQATLLACLDAGQRFRGDARFRTFLFGIARNKLYHYYRDRKRNPGLDLSITSVADLATTPGTMLARDQSHRALLAALRQLPVEQQTLLELHYWEEMDTVELAAVFEVPAATIRTWLFRARGKLRELLGPSLAGTLDDLDRRAREAREDTAGTPGANS
ncbi:MAG TPA: sigma-70 family RNA polymerase sigma factor [Kofleriaceae bacterium]|nr:sigma-70 family RNA polymerase sigma factor [Kofleriaceae bacterium]